MEWMVEVEPGGWYVYEVGEILRVGAVGLIGTVGGLGRRLVGPIPAARGLGRFSLSWSCWWWEGGFLDYGPG